VRDCIGHSYKLTVEECTNRYHFLAFKTREDAELFLENLKMGERVIQEIKNKKKEKDMKGKKIEITVPDGYDFVQEGNS
jgi:hypothetical protein